MSLMVLPQRGKGSLSASYRVITTSHISASSYLSVKASEHINLATWFHGLKKQRKPGLTLLSWASVAWEGPSTSLGSGLSGLSGLLCCSERTQARWALQSTPDKAPVPTKTLAGDKLFRLRWLFSCSWRVLVWQSGRKNENVEQGWPWAWEPHSV